MNPTYISLWQTNTVREKNDDYESHTNKHQQKEKQPILNHQQQKEQGENKPYYSKIDYPRTRQMGDNINTNNEQRQFNGGGGNGSNNNSIVSRKKINNSKRKTTIIKFIYAFILLLDNDLTASPKHNKSNSREYNKEIQQQKQYRGNNNNYRGQRNSGNARYRNNEQNNSDRVCFFST